METQRHEKEGQALLALRAACIYCTFIQIAHDNCNLDVGLGFISFTSVFFFFVSPDIIKEARKWTLFIALMLPETVI